MTARIAPHLPGCADRASDAFARGRILELRRGPRGVALRIGVVAGRDVQRDPAGAPDLAVWTCPRGTPPPTDPGWRTDVGVALLAAAGPDATGPDATGPGATGPEDGDRAAVLLREGPHEVLEDDLRWARGLGHAAGVLGRPAPPLLVLTRWGWHSLPDGRHRWWRRLRER